MGCSGHYISVMLCFFNSRFYFILIIFYRSPWLVNVNEWTEYICIHMYIYVYIIYTYIYIYIDIRSTQSRYTFNCILLSNTVLPLPDGASKVPLSGSFGTMSCLDCLHVYSYSLLGVMIISSFTYHNIDIKIKSSNTLHIYMYIYTCIYIYIYMWVILESITAG